jgi:ubiquinone/menaquinone biosynthesis C-methylase UbiE
MRVLDLRAGTGDTTNDAARRVGPAGSVLAVDISVVRIVTRGTRRSSRTDPKITQFSVAKRVRM